MTALDDVDPDVLRLALRLLDCEHQRAVNGDRFCGECGRPLTARKARKASEWDPLIGALMLGGAAGAIVGFVVGMLGLIVGH